MIPSDWEVCQLKHECSLITKGTTPSSLGYSFATTGINFLKIEAIEKSGKLIKENLAYIDEITNRALFRSQLQENDLLVSIAGALGRLFIVDASVLPANTNQALAIIRLKKNTLFNHKYLFYYLSSDPIQNLIKDLTVTGAQPNISLENVRNFLIGFPVSPKEQQRIANALSDVDTLIANLEKLIAKKKNIKQGAMQKLLTGKKRLPGFAPAKPTYKQTELGKIPTDWENVNISKTCTIKARIGWQGLKSTEYLNSGNYILVTGTDFKNGFIDWSTCSYVSEWRFKQDKNIQIRKGDVLVTKDGTIGKVAFLNEIPMEGTLNSGVFVVRSKDLKKIDSVYLSLVFKSSWFDNFLDEITSGSTIVHLYQKDFVKFNFPIPSSVDEQTAIANVLSDMDTEISALETKLAKYRKLKTGMMQQLLTGKIRLI